MKKTLLGISTLAMVLFNICVEYFSLNGLTRFEIIEQIPIYFLPSMFVYNIWYVIYVGLIVFAIYLFLTKKEVEDDLAKWMYVTYISNIVWVITWHYGLVALAVIAVLIQFLSLVQVYIKLWKYKKTIFGYGIFRIFFAWIIVATLSNIAAANYLARGGQYIFSAEWTAVSLMMIITFFALLTLKKHKDCLFATVILWAIFGILVKHFYTSEIIVNTAILLIITLIVGIVINAFRLDLPKLLKP